ncbi:hypothetical protein GO613_15670 [Azoarcus communis]|uniref:Uncharacterized protein n=1 Tax=Parazoarcus communis SWub3 = DSM 12120 TaxID=1121029 RepID=A0A323UQ37_9RHOO|nr:hypothetical protein [Parazoarcus communis]NMG49535.1 hypothetical protein [Parazoarcus communis]NMG71677.1 hypothetical protein [Parazoarcus communis SWub3 = DSM 12120]PZA14775.1 hypothetical protein DNK49_20035 [Azoarcus communis] [Parazoarcus communis SWub3 = DSM 12120]
MSVIFAKTQSGQDELTGRAGGLTPRQRRVLIMVDGKRTVDELRDMLHADDLQHTLGLLEESGFIEVIGMRGEDGAVGPMPDEPLPSITAFRPVPQPPDPKEMELARNFIQNTLKTFCGPFAYLHIVEAAHAAKTHEALRQQFDPWFNAIVLTREGRRRAEELRAMLLKVI